MDRQEERSTGSRFRRTKLGDCDATAGAQPTLHQRHKHLTIWKDRFDGLDIHRLLQGIPKTSMQERLHLANFGAHSLRTTCMRTGTIVSIVFPADQSTSDFGCMSHRVGHADLDAELEPAVAIRHLQAITLTSKADRQIPSQAPIAQLICSFRSGTFAAASPCCRVASRTSLLMAGSELNSMALRHARTAAFCAERRTAGCHEWREQCWQCWLQRQRCCWSSKQCTHFASRQQVCRKLHRRVLPVLVRARACLDEEYLQTQRKRFWMSAKPAMVPVTVRIWQQKMSVA